MPGMININASLSGNLSIKSKSSSLSGQKSLGGGVSNEIVNKDYNKLENLPTINGVLVKGDQTSETLKIKPGYTATYDQSEEKITFSL